MILKDSVKQDSVERFVKDPWFDKKKQISYFGDWNKILANEKTIKIVFSFTLI